MDRPEPEFAIGQRVRVILNDRNRTPHEGTIRAAIWHHKQGRFHYYLEEGGRKVSKRYTAEDLQQIGRRWTGRTGSSDAENTSADLATMHPVTLLVRPRPPVASRVPVLAVGVGEPRGLCRLGAADPPRQLGRAGGLGPRGGDVQQDREGLHSPGTRRVPVAGRKPDRTKRFT